MEFLFPQVCGRDLMARFADRGQTHDVLQCPSAAADGACTHLGVNVLNDAWNYCSRMTGKMLGIKLSRGEEPQSHLRHCFCNRLEVEKLACLSGPHRVLPTQRQEILRALDRLGDFTQQFLQVFVAIDEINV